MAAIKGRDTKPEMTIRRGLHARGFRFRLHDRKVPGTPDIVLRRLAALVDVRSCFFHGHDCHLFQMPKTREDFWSEKISSNRLRDQRNLEAQRNLGWRVAIIWECSLRGSGRLGESAVLDTLSAWLSSDEESLEIRGNA
jgi:DNA mismatch endonuclease (patch repair protein)